ncbi:hypothetical protein AGLY_016095 [Aphis glycines]|uniref:Uncharacterized protein n=1 Tax=Aphis glycines TaxID=307491 RepID=A0A6G0SYU3_APHGL|nr:hypothetical protein AGLY_016095 [Aphis glycines]
MSSLFTFISFRFFNKFSLHQIFSTIESATKKKISLIEKIQMQKKNYLHSFNFLLISFKCAWKLSICCLSFSALKSASSCCCSFLTNNNSCFSLSVCLHRFSDTSKLCCTSYNIDSRFSFSPQRDDNCRSNSSFLRATKSLDKSSTCTCKFFFSSINFSCSFCKFFFSVFPSRRSDSALANDS